MAILDWFIAPTKEDPVFGRLKFRGGAWWGKVAVPEYCSESVTLQIETQERGDFSPFYSSFAQLRSKSDVIKSRIAPAAFEWYSIQVSEDRKAGNAKPEDFDEFPTPIAADQIWNVLTPFRITLTDRKSHYNCILWLEVYWQNPHYFVAQLSDLDLYHFYSDG
jgi:hypothetical protein